MTFFPLMCARETPTIYEEAQAAEIPTRDKPSGHRKRGRPRKDIDIEFMKHMISNKAEAADVAKFFGVHRDTIYASYNQVVIEGRKLWWEKWSKISEVKFQNSLKKRKMKEELRKKKRLEYRAMYYQKHLK